MAITGTGGSANIGANKIAEIANWSLDMEADDVDTTTFDSNGWKEFLAGLKEWSGSMEGNFKANDTNGQKAILAAWLAGTPLTLNLKVSSTITFSGSAYVKPSIEVPVDDKASFSCDFQGTGVLTLPA